MLHNDLYLHTNPRSETSIDLNSFSAFVHPHGGANPPEALQPGPENRFNQGQRTASTRARELHQPKNRNQGELSPVKRHNVFRHKASPRPAISAAGEQRHTVGRNSLCTGSTELPSRPLSGQNKRFRVVQLVCGVPPAFTFKGKWVWVLLGSSGFWSGGAMKRAPVIIAVTRRWCHCSEFEFLPAAALKKISVVVCQT